MNLEFRLAADLVNGCLVGELGHELVCLDVDVLLAGWGLGSLHIASEEFFSSLGTLLLETLRVVLLLVRLEELVGVAAGRDDHGGVRASAEDALVKGDILREVSFLVDAAIRIFVLLLAGDDSGMGGEALAASTT